MPKAPTCRACGAALPTRPGPGRRARYCSVACRRAVEYARRRWATLQRQAAAREQQADQYPSLVYYLPRLRRQQAADLRERAGTRP